MINLVHISNNYGMMYDGIGAYAEVIDRSFSGDVKVKVYSSSCKKDGCKVYKIFNFGMTNTMWKSFFSFKKDNADVYLIEYPFMEWNPFFLFPMVALKIRILLGKRCFALSLHEYDRVNLLRKVVIKAICLISNIVFVSDNNMKSRIEKNAKVFIRPIPTNVCNKDIMQLDLSAKDKNHYAFFGLVSNTKAFDEMIEAWDIFNYDGHKKLDVITSSNISGLEKHRNVNYIYNADNNAILNNLKLASFSIVPVRPEVDAKNASFKTSSLAGCICLGKFCDEYANKKFVINMSDYSIKEFIRCLNQSKNMCAENLNDVYTDSHSFGLAYLPDRIAKLIEDILKEEVRSNDNLH